MTCLKHVCDMFFVTKMGQIERFDLEHKSLYKVQYII